MDSGGVHTYMSGSISVWLFFVIFLTIEDHMRDETMSPERLFSHLAMFLN